MKVPLVLLSKHLDETHLKEMSEHTEHFSAVVGRGHLSKHLFQKDPGSSFCWGIYTKFIQYWRPRRQQNILHNIGHIFFACCGYHQWCSINNWSLFLTVLELWWPRSRSWRFGVWWQPTSWFKRGPVNLLHKSCYLRSQLLPKGLTSKCCCPVDGYDLLNTIFERT